MRNIGHLELILSKVSIHSFVLFHDGTTALFSKDPYMYHQQGIYGYISLLDGSPQGAERIEGDTIPDKRAGPMDTNEYDDLSKSKLLSIYIIIFYSYRLPYSLDGTSKHVFLGAYAAGRTHVVMLRTITSPGQPFYRMIDIPTLPVAGKL